MSGFTPLCAPSLPIGQVTHSQPPYWSSFTPLRAPSLPIGQVTHSQPPYWSGFTPVRAPTLPIGQVTHSHTETFTFLFHYFWHFLLLNYSVPFKNFILNIFTDNVNCC